MKDPSFKPTWTGTIAIVAGCVISAVINRQGLSPYTTAHAISLVLLAGLACSILSDWRKGLRNLIRIDIFALLALYFLLYFEFLFPQPTFVLMAVADDIKTSIDLTLLGFASLTVGRHLVPPTAHVLDFVGRVQLRSIDYFLILLGAFLLSNFHMWLSVSFNPVDWFAGMLESRFDRPWARGRLGDASALLSELSLLSYVVPPIAGIMFARRADHAKLVLVITAALLLVQCFYAFSGGTRNVLAAYIAAFMGGYLIVQKTLRIRTIVLHVSTAAVLFIVAANYMLEFRDIGLGQYVREERYKPSYKEFHAAYIGEEAEQSGYFVDFNLFNISLLVAVFPDIYPYLGWNLPYVAFTKPVPRVLWPSKPTDLAVGLEEAVGARGYTIATTFVGEAYVAFGRIGVAATGLLLGLICGWWNSLSKHTHAPLALAVYTSGFFALLITMRSVMLFTTALLPALALLVFSRFLYARQNPN